MTVQSQLKEFETTEEMSATCKTALRNLLLACADTKLLLGFHYGEWTFGPPQIEAAIACCSLCQTELGHVRLLHGILNKHYGDDPDALVITRKPEEFANIAYLDREIEDWAKFVAANYIVDLAVTSVLFSMKDSAFKPLHMSLEKMLQEERYHIHHGQGWFRTLAGKSDETRAALQQSGREALAKVVEWFGPASESEDLELVENGIKAETNQVILEKFLQDLRQLADPLGVDLAFEKQSAQRDWSGWSPHTRRLTKSSPSEQILYHLRGSKNEVFKLN